MGAIFLGHRRPPSKPPKNKCLASFHFNPNLADFHTVQEVLTLFSELRITRLDLAADLIHPDAHKWKIIETRLSHTSENANRCQVPTFGSPRGERQIIPYDKVLERTEKGKRNIRVVDVFGEIHSFDTKELKEQDYGWLRVEARLRKSWVASNHPKANAFSDLFVLPSSVPDLASLELSPACEARLLGIITRPSLYGDFTTKTRAQIREDLRNCERDLLPVASPHQCLTEHHDEICDAIDRLLGLKAVAA